MTLEELLSHRNVEGSVYLCDIDRWLKVKLDFKDKVEIARKLTELYSKENHAQIPHQHPTQ